MPSGSSPGEGGGAGRAPGCRLLAVGSAAPPVSVSNSDLATFMDTSDEWVSSRTGIHSRRVAEPSLTLLELAARAARAALGAAGIAASEVDTVICTSSSPDQTFPSLACRLQAELGCPEGPAFDIQAACSGSIYGISVAQSLIATGVSRRVLVVAAEIFSRILDWADRSTAVLFGDAAGAFLVGGPSEPGAEIISCYLGADGGGAGSLDTIPFAPLAELPSTAPAYAVVPKALGRTVRMNGREVFRFSTKILEQVVLRLSEAAGIRPEEIDLVVPHQANSRILATAAGRLSLPIESFAINLGRYGNTSSASIPLALTEAAAAGRCRDGKVVCLVAFGAGLTWGGLLLRWEPTPIGIDDPPGAADSTTVATPGGTDQEEDPR